MDSFSPLTIVNGVVASPHASGFQRQFPSFARARDNVCCCPAAARCLLNLTSNLAKMMPKLLTTNQSIAGVVGAGVVGAGAGAGAGGDSTTRRFLMVPVYGGVGIGNQWVSLMVARMLAYLTRRTLVVDYSRVWSDYGGGGTGTGNVGKHRVFAHCGRLVESSLLIDDMLDYGSGGGSGGRELQLRSESQLHAFLYRHRDSYKIMDAADGWMSTCLIPAVIRLDDVGDNNDDGNDSSSADFQQFRAGRTGPIVNFQRLLMHRPEIVVRLRPPLKSRGDPLTYYFAHPLSLFYCRPDSRLRMEMPELLRQFSRPADAWLSMARGIARQHQLLVSRKQQQQQRQQQQQICCVHIRRTDKLYSGCHLERVSGTWIANHIAADINSAAGSVSMQTLVICTDDAGDRVVVELSQQWMSAGAAVNQKQRRVVFIDDLLTSANVAAASAAAAAAVDSPIERAFLSMLLLCVIGSADDDTAAAAAQDKNNDNGISNYGPGCLFYGTEGSTFSGYVHQYRNQLPLRYCNPPHYNPLPSTSTASSLHYSWGRSGLDPNLIAWFVTHEEQNRRHC
jgi:hypothetical protein